MTVTIGTSGGNKAVSAITVGTSGGNKTVLAGWVGTASGNKQFYSSIDVTPDEISWENLLSSNSWTSTNKTISGIDTPITLRFDVDASGDPGAIQYRKNSGTYTTFTSGDTLTVSSGDTLNFKLSAGGPNTTILVGVVNTTDGDASLGGFFALVVTV